MSNKSRTYEEGDLPKKWELKKYDNYYVVIHRDWNHITDEWLLKAGSRSKQKALEKFFYLNIL